jgi:hypothetical protein
MLEGWSIVLLRMRLVRLQLGGVGVCLGTDGGLSVGRGSRRGEDIEGDSGDETGECGEQEISQFECYFCT